MIIFITSFPGYSGFNKIIMDTIGQFIKFLYIKLQIVDALSLFPFYPDFDYIFQEELPG